MRCSRCRRRSDEPYIRYLPIVEPMAGPRQARRVSLGVAGSFTRYAGHRRTAQRHPCLQAARGWERLN